MSSYYTNLRGRVGFTLIELLVVMAVIAVLVGLTIPSLRAARSTARMIKCQAVLRDLGTQVLAYSYQHRDMLPMATEREDAPTGGRQSLPTTLGTSPVCPDDQGAFQAIQVSYRYIAGGMISIIEITQPDEPALWSVSRFLEQHPDVPIVEDFRSGEEAAIVGATLRDRHPLRTVNQLFPDGRVARLPNAF